MSRVSVWDPILDRFWDKSSVWKAKCLSIGGVFTLLKSILGSLGSYLMFMFLMPLLVIRSLNLLKAMFFWAVDLDERRMQ